MPPLRLPLVAALLGLLVLVPSASALQDRPAAPAVAITPAAVRSPDGVIVQWRPAADRPDKAEARADAEVSFAATLGDPDFQLVEVRQGQSPRDAVAELEASPAVAVAERDSYIAPHSLPDDPLFDQLWGLQNQGLGIGGFAGAVAGDDIDAVAAWDSTIGSPSVVVADIDSGYRFEHPDLANVAWTNPGETANGSDDDGNGIVDDLHGADFIGPNGDSPSVDGNPTDDDLISGGHGVHTAGTIGAEGDNGIGITGVAQDVRIMPLRVCSRFPSLEASRCSIASIVAAINYAGKKGARVANMSLGGPGALPQTEVNAIAANPAVLFVVSAGNDGEDNDGEPRYPCNFRPELDASPPVPGAIDNIVCVAATNQADGLPGFSDWGATSVDLGAPGTETLSSYFFTTPFAEDFGVDDFAAQWPATGADGGFERTSEAPLTSFGMTDAIGAPAADTVRETTSIAFTLPPNGGCKLQQTRRVVLGGTAAFRYSVLLDGSEQAVAQPGSTAAPGLERRFLELPSAFKAGGSVQLRFRFTAGAAPASEAGVWLDDLSIVCAQAVGQASAYAFLQGTSMAAPHVSGTAGLLFSLQPSATVTEVRDALLDTVDPVPSLDGKTVTGGRLNAAQALAELATPPAAPLLTATDPASPANWNNPRIVGSAAAKTSIRIFAGGSCGGAPVAVGSAAELQAPGIEVEVLDDSVNQFTATASRTASNISPCSAPISYTEQTAPPPDLTPPAAPLLIATNPPSPAADTAIRILGSAEPASSISVFRGAGCQGGATATGTAAELASPGIAVSVLARETSQFSATAMDAAENVSPCSAPISFTNAAAAEGGGGGGFVTVIVPPPPVELPPGPTPIAPVLPICKVPKLAGKTQGQATAALAAAGCKLGKVTKPKARKGRRRPSLVVKSSSPAAGAATSGPVNLTLGPKPKRPRH